MVEINNFRRLDEDKEPIWPTWKSAQSKTSTLGKVFGVVAGLLLWAGLILVFLLTAYLYWFQHSLEIILKEFKPGHYNIPWWFSLLALIFVAPLTLAVILVGTLIKVVKG